MPEIDVAAATEAIEGAGGFEKLMQDEATVSHGGTVPVVTPTDTTSTESTDGESAHWTQQQRDAFGRWQAEQAAASTDTETDTDFTAVDPSTLAPELQAIYKNLQADYTRKTQQLSEQRKAFEGLGPMEEIQQAIELRQTLSDPSNWPALHKELSDNLQRMGFSVADANAIAAKEVTTQAEDAKPTYDLSALGDDPELAPLKEFVENLQNQVKEIQAGFATSQEQAKQEQLKLQIVGELTRQENVIRESHPDYGQEDIDYIYEISSYHDGNLLTAQQRYEGMLQHRLERYLEGKQGAAAHGSTIPGGATSVSKPQEKFDSLDTAHAAAMKALSELESMST